MTKICQRCERRRAHRARGLCDACYRWHRDEYPPWDVGENPLTCECVTPRLVPVGGVWDALGATVCERCQRPQLVTS